eukprot:CAMPEP_0171053616 /NCGR_PEP_ID=MMETSP0736-20130129/54603_1 /TAXON_ID=186038 /ORGANISM="Fragilariopsis kerguelensis, Strain L26-C5" /LENGTH=57 /DNA_ID=CAMNT_0011507615 /DNA_START=88 /DNA_END=261 /DNA_ORIENTATION=-
MKKISSFAFYDGGKTDLFRMKMMMLLVAWLLLSPYVDNMDRAESILIVEWESVCDYM